MCFHVYETDTDDEVVEEWRRAARARDRDNTTYRAWYQSQVDRIEKEAVRRGIQQRLVLD